MWTKVTVVASCQIFVKYFPVLDVSCVKNVFDVGVSSCTVDEAYCFCVCELVWRLDGVRIRLYCQVSESVMEVGVILMDVAFFSDISIGLLEVLCSVMEPSLTVAS